MDYPLTNRFCCAVLRGQRALREPVSAWPLPNLCYFRGSEKKAPKGAFDVEVGGLVGARRAALCQETGSEPLVTDALAQFRPNAVIHQLTALPSHIDLRDFDAVFAQTNPTKPPGSNN